MLSGL